jgi:hypothetical protein
VKLIDEAWLENANLKECKIKVLAGIIDDYCNKYSEDCYVA